MIVNNCFVVLWCDFSLGLQYVLTILEPEYRQIVGEYSLVLNDYNTKTMYPHMSDHCESMAPDYIKSESC